MIAMSGLDLPPFCDWSIAAVRLLQGVIYSDEARVWDLVLGHRSQLEEFCARLGLLMVVDESEGLAYLRQLEDDECPAGYDAVPKLFRKSRLSYDTTLLCVLLREELRRFEEEELHNERCVVEAATLFDRWKSFFPSQHDEVRQRREFDVSLHKLAELDFVRRFSDDPAVWEVRRILKARLPVAELEQLKAKLLAATPSDTAAKGAGDQHG
jgi:hypothetical protein